MIAAEYRRKSRSRHDFRLHHRRYRHKRHSSSASNNSYHRHTNHKYNDRYHRHTHYHKMPHSRSRGRCSPMKYKNRNKNNGNHSLVRREAVLHKNKHKSIAHETKVNEIQHQPPTEIKREYSYFSETSGELSIHHRHEYGGHHRKPLEQRRVRLKDNYHHCNGCACNKYSLMGEKHTKECSKSKKNSAPIDNDYKLQNDRGSVDTKSDDEDDDSTGEDLEGLVMYKNVQTIYRERYSIVGKIGQGTFGTVLECYDTKRDINVAVKIVRSVKKYLDAAELEIDILNKLDEYDIDNHSLIIPLYKAFRTHISGSEHACLVFKKCGLSLYDYIKKNNYRGFCLHEVIYIAYQLFHAIEFCHLNKLIHTDLKLENILFTSTRTINCYPQQKSDSTRKQHSSKHKHKHNVRMYGNHSAGSSSSSNDNIMSSGNSHLIPDSLETRLIDFGGATFESDHHSSIINTRQYRGPEVIFGLSWSYSSDIWSIGCILAELYTGELLFQTHEDLEHLALMEKILQQTFSKHMIGSALKKKLIADKKLSADGANVRGNVGANVRGSGEVSDVEGDDGKHCRSVSLTVVDMFDNQKFSLNWPQLAVDSKSIRYVDKCLCLESLIDNYMLRNLIMKCLQFEPNKRITARDAKKHMLFEKFAKVDLQFSELVKKLSVRLK